MNPRSLILRIGQCKQELAQKILFGGEQDQSCRNAVAKIWAWLSVLGGEWVNSDTGSYCDARKRLPEALLSRLAAGKASDLEAQVQDRDLWHGRRVRIVDGGCVSMPDTPENQKAYPQPSA